jgi:hypothetical protein
LSTTQCIVRRTPGRLPTGQNVVMLDGLIQVEPWEIERWCRNHLGSGIDVELFRYGHLSTVIGIRLNSGLQVVVKVRQASDRLVACACAHRALFELGFPCPELLVDMAPFGEQVASAEVMTAATPSPNQDGLRNLSLKHWPT